MNVSSISMFKLGIAFSIILICVGLNSCRHSADNGYPITMLPTELPVGQLAFTFRHCEDDDADIHLLTLPDGDIKPILQGPQDDRSPAWSPNGQMLGMLSYKVNKRILRIVDLTMPDVYTELGRDVQQFSWSTDGTSLFYLDHNGDLYQYYLKRDESKHIISDVSNFSVAPNGKWLSLSIRDLNRSRAFTFYVLDLSDGHLLTIADRRDVSLGINKSFWSPTADEIAVLSGPNIEIYEIRENHLYVKAAASAHDIYQRDFGQDLISVALIYPVWSPDGQNLLLIHSLTDAKLGGEALLFDAALSDYQRLPFGNNVTYAAWTKDSRWLAYITSSQREDNLNSCMDRFRGKIWLADMETLKTQVLAENVFSIYRPSWRPQH